MAEDTATAKPVTVVSRTAALVSLGATVTFVVLLAALHVIKWELNPSWHPISEYEIGRHGWMMVLAFLSLALSYVTLFVAIRPQIRTTAAIFTTDPITASQDELTTHGNLHRLGTLLGLLTVPIAATLIGRSLPRDQAWFPARRLLQWMAGLTWISLLVFFLSVAVMLSQSGREFGPDVLIGWPNRLIVLAYSGWRIVVAWYALRLSRQNPTTTWRTGAGRGA